MMRRIYQAVTAAFLAFCVARLFLWGPGGALGILTGIPFALWAGMSCFALGMARYDDQQWLIEGRPRGYSYGPAFAAALFGAAVACLQYAAGSGANTALWAFLAGYSAYWGWLRHGAYQARLHLVTDPRAASS
jgi:hypothetical protein